MIGSRGRLISPCASGMFCCMHEGVLTVGPHDQVVLRFHPTSFGCLIVLEIVIRKPFFFFGRPNLSPQLSTVGWGRKLCRSPPGSRPFLSTKLPLQEFLSPLPPCPASGNGLKRTASTIFLGRIINGAAPEDPLWRPWGPFDPPTALTPGADRSPTRCSSLADESGAVSVISCATCRRSRSRATSGLCFTQSALLKATALGAHLL